MKKIWSCLAVAALVLAVVVMLIDRSGEASAPSVSSSTGADGARETARSATADRTTAGRGLRSAPQLKEDEGAAEESPESVADESQTEEEKREAEEEKLVNAFDGLTDKWQEPSAKGVTMADIDTFAQSFRKIPKARQDECIHRALNLIPDENVMLLAGVLMDKSMDKEIVETVYNDVLNRDEDVKKPILQEIFKDKSHPCWSDTAWILDVTGELPESK